MPVDVSEAAGAAEGPSESPGPEQPESRAKTDRRPAEAALALGFMASTLEWPV